MNKLPIPIHHKIYTILNALVADTKETDEKVMGLSDDTA
jgi:hypothetical protein